MAWEYTQNKRQNGSDDMLPAVPTEASISTTLLGQFATLANTLISYSPQRWWATLMQNGASNASWFTKPSDPLYYTFNYMSPGSLFGVPGILATGMAGANMDSLAYQNRQFELDAGPILADDGDFSSSLSELKRLETRINLLRASPAYPAVSYLEGGDASLYHYVDYEKENVQLINTAIEKRDLLKNYLDLNGISYQKESLLNTTDLNAYQDNLMLLASRTDTMSDIVPGSSKAIECTVMVFA